MPETTAAEKKFDPIQFTLRKPMATPQELAVACGQLIDGIADISGAAASRVVTATLSAVTISWKADTIPSEEWIADVQEQLRGFAACSGIHIFFRRH